MIKVGDYIELVNGMRGHVVSLQVNTALVFVNGEYYRVNVSNLKGCKL